MPGGTLVRRPALPYRRPREEGAASPPRGGRAPEGKPGDELFLLLDRVLAVEVGDERLAEIGPGAILGERALLEGATRTATLRAVTKCKVAVTTAEQVDRSALEEISADHRREENATDSTS
jgi:CRP-like cAMP-binding protein